MEEGNRMISLDRKTFYKAALNMTSAAAAISLRKTVKESTNSGESTKQAVTETTTRVKSVRINPVRETRVYQSKSVARTSFSNYRSGDDDDDDEDDEDGDDEGDERRNGDDSGDDNDDDDEDEDDIGKRNGKSNHHRTKKSGK